MLAVDDDPQALRYVREALIKSGYAPIVTADPEEALRLVDEERPHLVLLDLVLPWDRRDRADERHRGDGGRACHFPVSLWPGPARGQSLRQGGLRLRGQALLAGGARGQDQGGSAQAETPEPRQPYVLGDLTINYAERRVTIAGRPVELTAIEYGMLAELSANAGRVLTYERLLRRVWRL